MPNALANNARDLEVTFGKAVFKLHLRGNVTVLKGDSGQGRTLLAQALEHCIEGGSEEYVAITPKTRVFCTVPHLQLFRNRVIIIDDFDEFKSRAVVNYILRDTANHYILCLRDTRDVHISPFYVANLIQQPTATGVEITLEYHHNNALWG